jgi:hypothetical protein
MLPDFPTQKEKLLRLLTDYHERRHEAHLGFLSSIPAYRNHEGDQWSLERADGTSDDINYQSIEATLTLRRDEIPSMTWENLQKKIDAVAEEMARQQSVKIFEDIQKTVDDVGNTISAEGGSVTKELFLEMLRRVWIDFDEAREPIMPAIVMHPNAWEAHGATMKSWEEDPDFKAQQHAIITQKREEWRVRESCRKLVD